jgi:lysophospholipase L1-like esterase
MTHIVLLGDSIFDNAPYVQTGDAVIYHLKRRIPNTWKTTLLAIDGAVTREVQEQIQQVPSDATHLFLSVGGNDALRQIDYLRQPAGSVAEVMLEFTRFSQDFAEDYRDTIASLLSHQLPTIVCTIYNPSFEQADQNTIASMALTFWNNVITQTAIIEGLPIIELRQIFTNPEDYANPIEPSSVGGAKLVEAIAAIVEDHDFTQTGTIVYGR